MTNNLFSANSRWIWLDRVADENCYLEFMTEFRAEGEGAQLLLTAEGQYVAFLDGAWLPSTQYPDFPHRKSVQRIELPALTKGKHALEIQVHYDGIDTSVTRKELPGLRFELWQNGKLLAASGTETLARPLAGYINGPVPLITGQLGVGFSWADLPAEPWQTAKVVEKSCTFAPRPIPELEVSPLLPARLYSQGVFISHESGCLCHGWSGIPAYLFGAYVLGVRPVEPGVWTVHEEPAILHYAEGTLLTPQGKMRVVKHK